MSKRKALRLMALGFRSAMEHACGGAGKMLAEVEDDDRDALLQSKYLQTMLTAIPIMVEYKLAPAAWSLFSIMVWRKYVMTPRGWQVVPSRTKTRSIPPNPSFVFSEKRLRERTDWFGFYESHCRGGKLLISDGHRDLVGRYLGLKLALLSLEGPSETEVREVVNSRLTQATIDRLAKKIQQDYDYKQEELDARVQGGEWLW